MRKIKQLVLVLCLGLAFSHSLELADLLKKKIKQKASYPETGGTSLAERIKDAPDFIINTWQEWDETTNYLNYRPGPAETAAIKTYMEMLPELHKRVMQERLLAVYFVENFLGNGLADWVVNNDHEIYCYLIFNPDTLKYNLADLVTRKEKTCFKDDAKYSLKIELSTNYLGFLYILLHEGTHVVDYARLLTPYPEKHMPGVDAQNFKHTPFTAGTWQSYSLPLAGFKYKEKITFYGFSGGPRLKLKKGIKVYRSLAASPFCSLYASQSWAEDLAELLTFYHLKEKLGLDYRIIFAGRDETFILEPLANPLVAARFAWLEQAFYSQ